MDISNAFQDDSWWRRRGCVPKLQVDDTVNADLRDIAEIEEPVGNSSD